MWALLGAFLFLQYPETVDLVDQFGEALAISSQPEMTTWVILAADPRSVRALAKWLKRIEPEFLEAHSIFCVVDIRDMPERIKNQRFLPQIKASELRIFVIDDHAALEWVPKTKGKTSVLQLERDKTPVFHLLDHPEQVVDLVQ